MLRGIHAIPLRFRKCCHLVSRGESARTFTCVLLRFAHMCAAAPAISLTPTVSYTPLLLIVRYSGIGIWCANNPLPSPTPTNPKPTNAEWEMRGLVIIALNGVFLGLWIFGFVCMLLSHDYKKCSEQQCGQASRSGGGLTPPLTPGGSGGGITFRFTTQNPLQVGGASP